MLSIASCRFPAVRSACHAVAGLARDHDGCPPAGRIVPPLDQVRDEIEKTLMEAKIESDTDTFLDTARERAEVVMLNPV